MSLVDTLRRTRALLAGGWSEPLPRDSAGRWCTADDEGVSTFSVLEAMELCGGREDLDAALELLEAVALPAAAAFGRALERAGETGQLADAEVAQLAAQVPGAGGTLQAWLERPGRTVDQVLRLFDVAILRASARATSSTREGIHG